MPVHVFASCILMVLSVDETLVPRYVNSSINFRGPLLVIELSPFWFWLTHLNLILFALRWRPMPPAASSRLCSWDSAWVGVFARSALSSALLLNRIEHEIGKILRKNQNIFRRNRSQISQILTIHRVIEGVQTENLEAKLLVDFSKGFDSIYRGKIEQLLLAFDLQKETATAIMMFNKNTKAKVRSPD